MSTVQFVKRFAIACAAAGVGLFGVAGVVSAHVSIEQTEIQAGAYELVTVSVPHGCDGSPTTEVRIQMPASIVAVTPTVNANWEVDKIMLALDEPITDAHGAEISERVSEVVYTAKTPLPDGYRDAFTLSLRVPDDASGPLYFPTVQICEEGESGWIEIPADGQDPEELELPSPVVEVLPAAGESEASDGHADGDAAAADGAATDDDHDDAATEAAAEVADVAGDSDADDGSSNALALAALVVGVLALGTGAYAISRTRKS